MAEKELGPEFWIHGGGLDLVFPHHENERAQSLRSRTPVRAHLDAQRDAAFHRREDVEVGRERHDHPRSARHVGARDRARVLPDGALAQADRLLRRDDASAAAQAETLRNALRGETRSSGDWDALRSSARRRLQHACRAGCDARVGASRGTRRASPRARRVRPRALAASEDAPPDVVALAEERVAARAADATSPTPTGSATRSREAGWEVRDVERRISSSCRAVTRDLVYGRNAVREALRGRRAVLELWAGERAAASLEWLDEGPRPRIRKERELTEAAGSPDHQGVVAWCEPYPYADAWELATVDRPLICCLDQVTDPRNLGAVVRSAAGAGATGVVVPAHGATVVTPAVCRSSAGAVEHLPVAVVPNLARYLGEVKGDRLWAYAAAADGDATALGRRSDRRRRARPRGRRERGAATRAPDVRRDDRDSPRPGRRIAQRERRGGRRAVRGTSPARAQSQPRLEVDSAGRSLYLFDGSNMFHAGRFEDRDELVDLLSSFVAVRGARGVVVFDGVGEDRVVGPLSVRFAPQRRRGARAARGGAPLA